MTVKEADKNITLTGGVIGDGTVIYDKDNHILTNSDSTAVSIPASFVGTGTDKDNAFTLSSGMITVNASTRKKQIIVTGNDNANVIIGGDGNDTLKGNGVSNSLTGGKGNDEFVFIGGNDTITDYSAKSSLGADKINDSSMKYLDFIIEGDNVILGYEDNSSLTIVKGKGQQISFIGSNKKTDVKVYDANGVYDGKGTSMTLASGLSKAFDATSSPYDKLITIDGTKTAAATITGNAKGNIITASGNGATMNGKAGNDTLIGGEGADVFVYESGAGNDFISLCGGNDTISLVGSGANITDVTIKEDKKNSTKDLIVKVGKGTITIKDGASSDNEGITFVSVDSGTMSGDGVFTTTDETILFPSFSGTVSSDKATINASSVKAGITIENDGNGYVMGGNGKDTLSGAGTLWGGKGNDLIDGSGATVIYHAGEGTDTITGLSLTDAFGTTPRLMLYDKGTSSVGITKGTFNKDGLSLAVSGGGNVILADHGLTEPSEEPIVIKGEKWYVGQAKNGSLTFTTTPYKRPEE